jgi:acyl-CoA synthetase (NDP forming)
MAIHESLDRLLRPRTIAVFGGDSAAKVVHQCKEIGFDGDLWVVNPRRKQIEGIACVASIDELPSIPDASFIAAPPLATLDIVRELAEKSAPGAVCFAAGFAETGDDGADLQRQLREAAGDMAVIGPNCHGYLNYIDGVALWPDEHGSHRVETGVALISQSGNIAINLTMNKRGLDIAYVISVGNNSTLGIHDYIEALLLDSRVTAIGLHIEGITDVAAFSVAAIKALRKGIPIVALKAGRSKRGAEITRSHTGSLSGSDRLYSALFSRFGIARCDTVPQFLETLKFLSIVGPLTDSRIASLSCSGGEASLVADCAERLQIQTPQFEEKSAARMQEILGANVSVSNPLDYHMYVWGDFDKLRDGFTEVLQHEFDCTLLVLDYPPGDEADTEGWEIAEQALVAAVKATKQTAAIVSSLPETLPENVRNRLKASGLAPMQGIEDCLYAIRAAALVGQKQRTVDRLLPVMEVVSVSGPVDALDEWASKQVLGNCGLKVPAGKLCNAEDVVDAANTLHFPVVLKAVSAELAHKTEAGAVAINLDNTGALADALQSMLGLSDQFLVEEMAGPVVTEMIIGVSRDETFGLTLMIGAGGTLVELLDDTKSLLLPLQAGDVETAIAGLKVSKLIDGFRSETSGDKAAFIHAVEAVARYACEQSDSLVELDVNPLLVLTEGAVAVDAYIRTTTNDQT